MPILVLTSSDAEFDEVMSMKLGADGYLSKPYRPAVLLAHVARLLQRAGSAGASRIEHSGIALDIARAAVCCGGSELPLSRNETWRVAGLTASLGVLACAYWQLAINGMQMIDEHFWAATALMLVGTFLFFWSGAGFSIFALTRAKAFYLKGIRMFTVRQVASKVNTAFVSMGVRSVRAHRGACIELDEDEFTLIIAVEAFDDLGRAMVSESVKLPLAGKLLHGQGSVHNVPLETSAPRSCWRCATRSARSWWWAARCSPSSASTRRGSSASPPVPIVGIYAVYLIATYLLSQGTVRSAVIQHTTI